MSAQQEEISTSKLLFGFLITIKITLFSFSLKIKKLIKLLFLPLSVYMTAWILSSLQINLNLSFGLSLYFVHSFVHFHSMNFSMETSSSSLSNKELNSFGFKVLTAWCVVFITEATLILLGNLYAIAFLIRGRFNLVRYFAISLSFTDILRGLAAVAIFLGLLRSDGHHCSLNHDELHLSLQTLCDTFSTSFLAAISLDMYYRTFWPLTHIFTRFRCYMTANFLIWILSMVVSMTFAFALAGFYRVLIAKVVVWFVEIINLTIIVTNYILIWKRPSFNRNATVWKLQTQNFYLSRAFALCAIIYFAMWLPVEILEGTSYLTWDFPCNAVLLMRFIKTFCSLVSPVVYATKLSRFSKPLRCTILRCEDKKTRSSDTDSLAVITLRSATYLITAL